MKSRTLISLTTWSNSYAIGNLPTLMSRISPALNYATECELKFHTRSWLLHFLFPFINVFTGRH